MAAGPNGHARGLTPGTALRDRGLVTELLQVSARGRSTIVRTVRIGHVGGLTPGMAGRDGADEGGAA
jgi:hypothetical protein